MHAPEVGHDCGDSEGSIASGNDRKNEGEDDKEKV